jgi:purine-binding chemotaxis protein CheW
MSERRSFLIFKTSGRSFACAFEDILHIEAARGIEITPAPEFPPYMPGTAVIDGEVMPVIDAALRFGFEIIENRERSCFIVSELSRGGEYKKCALLADEAAGSVQIDGEDILSPPDVNEDSFVSYVSGMFQSGGETCYIISPEKTVGI